MIRTCIEIGTQTKYFSLNVGREILAYYRRHKAEQEILDRVPAPTSAIELYHIMAAMEKFGQNSIGEIDRMKVDRGQIKEVADE